MTTFPRHRGRYRQGFRDGRKTFIVLTCNTAHYFHDRFQALTDCADSAYAARSREASVAALPGKHRIPARRLPWHRGFARFRACTSVPSRKPAIRSWSRTDALQARITSLIYDDVKGSGELNLEPV